MTAHTAQLAQHKNRECGPNKNHHIQPPPNKHQKQTTTNLHFEPRRRMQTTKTPPHQRPSQTTAVRCLAIPPLSPKKAFLGYSHASDLRPPAAPPLVGEGYSHASDLRPPADPPLMVEGYSRNAFYRLRGGMAKHRLEVVWEGGVLVVCNLWGGGGGRWPFGYFSRGGCCSRHLFSSFFQQLPESSCSRPSLWEVSRTIGRHE